MRKNCQWTQKRQFKNKIILALLFQPNQIVISNQSIHHKVIYQNWDLYMLYKEIRKYNKIKKSHKQFMRKLD